MALLQVQRHRPGTERNRPRHPPPGPRPRPAVVRGDMSSRITRGVMAARMVKTARALHIAGMQPDPEYTRGQVDLICLAAGLGDEYRERVKAFITGEMTDDEFGLVLAMAVFQGEG